MPGEETEHKCPVILLQIFFFPEPKKPHQVRRKIKVILAVFFNLNDVVHCDFASEGQRVNNKYSYCLQILRRLREASGHKSGHQETDKSTTTKHQRTRINFCNISYPNTKFHNCSSISKLPTFNHATFYYPKQRSI